MVIDKNRVHHFIVLVITLACNTTNLLTNFVVDPIFIKDSIYTDIFNVSTYEDHSDWAGTVEHPVKFFQEITFT